MYTIKSGDVGLLCRSMICMYGVIWVGGLMCYSHAGVTPPYVL